MPAPSVATPLPSWDPALLARVEDAGLNASAPPQQRWLDGWLVRTLPGKARRARCINALGPGAMPLAGRLAEADRIMQAAGVPTLFRISRFTQPPALDDWLARQGFVAVDPTAVMVATPWTPAPGGRPCPPGVVIEALDAAAFAETVGALRGSPPEHRASHAWRLAQSPVPHQARVLRETTDGTVLACGQWALEAGLVGLYDVFTRPDRRGEGWASLLCEHLLAEAAREGATAAYLQVDADNAPALAVYRRLGFREAYRYHYRERPAPAA